MRKYIDILEANDFKTEDSLIEIGDDFWRLLEFPDTLVAKIKKKLREQYKEAKQGVSIYSTSKASICTKCLKTAADTEEFKSITGPEENISIESPKPKFSLKRKDFRGLTSIETNTKMSKEGKRSSMTLKKSR